jgi:bacteriorhodopsin
MALILGMLGTALGATSVEKFSSWHTVARIDVIATICAAFFSYVVGGWVAGKITGARYSEPTILHAVIAWLVSTPLLVAMLALGAGTTFGGWYGGLITSPIGAPAAAVSPEIVRDTAIAAVTALLIGIIGSVIGGWMASGEPMTFTYYRHRIPKPQSQKVDA